MGVVAPLVRGLAQQGNEFAQLLVVAEPQQLAAAAVVFRCELIAIEPQAAAIVHQAGEQGRLAGAEVHQLITTL